MTHTERLAYLRRGAERDGAGCLTAAVELGGGSACEVETAELYHGLARREKFKLVVTTGTHRGFDTAFIAAALEENGEGYPDLAGRVVTVDSTDYGASALWSRLGLDNVRQVVGDSRDPDVYRDVEDGSVDWFHADADHAGEALLAEFAIALPLLNRRRCFFSTHDSRLDARLAPAIRAILLELRVRRGMALGWKLVSWWPLRGLRGLDLIYLSNEEY